jgi:hypothetical protein|tara:strand:- start:87 stop:725 length:639 start_codon:yes stop_codon:yes gene_type:complete
MRTAWKYLFIALITSASLTAQQTLRLNLGSTNMTMDDDTPTSFESHNEYLYDMSYGYKIGVFTPSISVCQSTNSGDFVVNVSDMEYFSSSLSETSIGINGLIEINSGTFGASSFSWLSLQTEVSALYNLKKDYYITSPYISPIYVDDQKRRWRGRFTYGLKIDLNKKYAVSIHSNIVKYLPVDGYSYWIMEATDFFYTHNFVSNSIAIHYKF